MTTYVLTSVTSKLKHVRYDLNLNLVALAGSGFCFTPVATRNRDWFSGGSH